jgi:hypothetical protein
MTHEFHPGDIVKSLGGGCVRVIDHLGPNLLDSYVPLAHFVGGGSWPISEIQLVARVSAMVPESKSGASEQKRRRV